MFGGVYETYQANKQFGRPFTRGDHTRQITSKRVNVDQNRYLRNEREARRGMGEKELRNERREKFKALASMAKPLATADTVEARMIKGTLLNAGLTLVYESLGKIFQEHNLNLDSLKQIDPALTWGILSNKLQMDNKQTAAVMKVVQNQVDVIYMQGSASYLFKELDLDGVLISKANFVERIEEEIEKVTLDGGMDLKLFANCLLCRTLLYSSATPGLNFYSQRTCRGQKDDIHTQLWFGYASALAVDFMNEKTNPDGFGDFRQGFRACVVDVGSGETKRFHAVKHHPNSALRQVGKEEKRQNEGLQGLMAELIQACKNHIEGTCSKRNTYLPGDTAESETIGAMTDSENLATKFVAAVFGNSDEIMKNERQTDVVRVFGTGSVRKMFADRVSKGTRNTKTSRLAKEHLLQTITEALKAFVRKNNMLRPRASYTHGDDVVNDDTVQFIIMSQTDEASYEFAAAEEAFLHAIDLPLEIQRGNASYGNLAWGNGSLQGFPQGKIGNWGSRGMQTNRALTLSAGLKNIQDAIEEHFCGDNFKSRKALMENDNQGHSCMMKKIQKTCGATYEKKDRFGEYHLAWNGKKHSPRIKIVPHALKKAYQAVRKIVRNETGTTPIELFQTPDMLREDDDYEDVDFGRARAGSVVAEIARFSHNYEETAKPAITSIDHATTVI